MMLNKWQSATCYCLLLFDCLNFYYANMFSIGPPSCQSLEFCGSMMEGECLRFVATYTGGLVSV